MPDSLSTPPADSADQKPQDGAPIEPEVITLDPKNLTAEIRRLQQENADFLQIFNTEVGNHAAKQASRKYEPEIKKLQRELEEERIQRRKAEILSMDEADITKRFGEDAAFAEDYAKIVHYKPQAVEDDPTPLIAQAWEEAEQFARDNGVSDEFINTVTQKAINGGYASADEHWSLGIRRIQQDFTNEILRVKSGNKAAAFNPALVKGSADVTPASRGSGGGFTFKSVREFKDLPLSEQRSILDQPEGMKYVEELMKKG